MSSEREVEAEGRGAGGGRDLTRRDAYLFELPQAQVAAHPAARRDASRLLVVDGARRAHHRFSDLPGLLRAGDLLVLNDVRVEASRLFVEKETGGQVEVLILDATRAEGANAWRLQALVRANRALRVGQRLRVADPTRPGRALAELVYEGSEEGSARLTLAWAGALSELLERVGEMPLPPYIRKRRKDLGQAPHAEADRARYQTVYAREGRAAAAPTAGLHFTPELLEALTAAGVELARLRLDVGVGTFRPVQVERLDEHPMHSETYALDAALVAAHAATRARGGRVVAVGTTVTRALEDQWRRFGALRAGVYETDLFLRPGHRFGAIDGLITNFHLPGSTLLVLVAGLGGYRAVMDAYAEAVAAGYRFYSYGDAMLVWPAREEEAR